MKSKKYTDLKRLFKQYKDGSIHQSQKEIIDGWFEQHLGGEMVDLLKNPEDEERIYRELSRRIIQPPKPVGIIHQLTRATWLRAACIILLAGIAGLYYTRHTTITDAPKQVFHTFHTGNGQVQKIELEDGSVVWLNAATTLRVPKPFKQRAIYLDKGEAFFEVKHDVNRPFTVTTGNLVTRDIGTSFNIRAYHAQTEYRVEVASGQVAVERLNGSGKTDVLMEAICRGQVLVYNAADKKSQVSQKDIALIRGWKTDRSLYLDKLTLPEIAEELSRRFNIRATVKHPEFDQQKYTIDLGTRDLGASLRELTLLTGMSYELTLLTGMSYELTPNNLIINPSASSMK
jgi:transmembrane sensor